jgi:hypothetical protein
MNKKRIVGLAAVLALLGALALADPPPPVYPQWWLDYGVVTAQPPSSSNSTAYDAWMQTNYAPVNLGQLKNFAAQASAYMNAWLSADTNTTVESDLSNISANVSGFGLNSTVNNYAPANLGQVKNVAQPFYDLLTAVGYNTTASLNYELTGNANSGNWTNTYPWINSTANTTNYSPVNLGQLKFVFNFDLSDAEAYRSGTAGYLQVLLESMLGGNPGALGSGTPDTDGDGANDGTDLFPLDPAFNAIPSLGGNDTTVPHITLTAPSDAVLIE